MKCTCALLQYIKKCKMTTHWALSLSSANFIFTSSFVFYSNQFELPKRHWNFFNLDVNYISLVFILFVKTLFYMLSKHLVRTDRVNLRELAKKYCFWS